MRFYDMLQLDPAVLKKNMRAAQTAKERYKIQASMVVRSMLLVGFSILFIAPMGKLFGSENSPMAVALLCILLSVRFVDFGYCIKDSMFNLAIVFLLLLFAPVATTFVHPILAVLIHFTAFMIILLMTCEQPEMGNGGLYGFSYIFLTGNPVTGVLLWKRFILTLVGYLICGTIFYFKHRNKNTEVRFRDVVARFDMTQDKSKWQLRMAIGIGLVLTLGSALHLERFMWMGFACGSLLSSYPYSAQIKERCWQRVLGVIAGSALFFVIYQLTPDSMHSLLGPLGGFCLGFCSQYYHKTMINCLGALLIAAGIYGAPGAALLRIQNNLLGVLFGFVFILVYHKLTDKLFQPQSTMETNS